MFAAQELDGGGEIPAEQSQAASVSSPGPSLHQRPVGQPNITEAQIQHILQGQTLAQSARTNHRTELTFGPA